MAPKVRKRAQSGRSDAAGGSVVYCDVTEQNRVAMSRHRHNVASRHYDGSRRCCYSWNKLVTVKKIYIYPASDTSDADDDLHDTYTEHVIFSFKSK
jgi:hypothetical protein